MKTVKIIRMPWLRFGAYFCAGLAAMTSGTGCHYTSTGHNIEGRKLYDQGRYAESVQRFQQALAVNQADVDAYYNMGAAYHQMARQSQNQQYYAQAESLYKHALQYDPNHADSYRGLAVLMTETDRKDPAFAMMRNWVLQNQQSAEARYELARLYREHGDLKTAQLQLESALQLDPKSYEVLNELAYIREQSGDVPQALANYQRSYSLNSFQPQVAARIAQLQQIAGPTYGTPTAPNGTRMVHNLPPVSSR